MFIEPLLRPFKQLRWKLTLSYTAVTISALLAVEIVLILGMSHYLAQESIANPERLLHEIEDRYVPLARTYLSKTPKDIVGLREALESHETGTIDVSPIRLGNFLLSAYSTTSLHLVFLNSDGRLIDSLPHDFITDTHVGELFNVEEISGIEYPLKAVLAGEKDYSRLYTHTAKNRLVGALPIVDEFGKGNVVGVVVFMQKMGIWEVWTLSQIAKQVVGSLLFITLFAGLMGTVFGSLTSRDFVQRLSGLFSSARSWSQGDFSVSVDDTAGDELGQLAQGLNEMVAQLENLLEDRQRISVIEERNRLARDLHDSVKQQAFAASAQLAAAQVHIGPDPQEAIVHVSEAQKLLLGVRQELTDLILELRPVALQGRGLAAAIREYACDCACQSQIEIDVRVQGHRPLPLQVEQSLFRIVQGALANVVRHSHASQAKVELLYEPTSVRLAISDNGKGFCADVGQTGLGLCSIRERVELIDGCMLIDSKIGAGTKIVIRCNY